MIVTFLAGLVLASTPGDFQARISQLQREVRQNRDLDDEQRALLESKLAKVEQALAQVEAVTGQGTERRKRMDSLMTASTAVVANDITGVGAADNVLIPILGLAAIATWLQTSSPAPDADVDEAWNRLRDALDAAVKAGQTVLMAQQAGTKARSLTLEMAKHLAVLLDRSSIGGIRPPDKDPTNNKKHWWKEIKNFLEQIRRLKYSEKQLMRELGRQFTREQIAEIVEALRQAAKLMEETPTGTPPFTLL
jgi:hypothetical protein